MFLLLLIGKKIFNIFNVFFFFFFIYLINLYSKFESNVEIKGKALSNDSLEKCSYSDNYDICLPGEIKCLEEDYGFEPCDDNGENHSIDKDECERLYNYFEKEKSGSYRDKVIKCTTNGQGEIKAL